MNNWDKTENGTDLTLNKYIGKDADSVYIPNAANIRTDSGYQNVQKVIITKDTITSMVGKTHNLTVSGTAGEKVYAQGDMSYLFNDDYALNNNVGDLSNWNTHNVGTAAEQNYSFAIMFANCENLAEVKGIEYWYLTNARSMRNMFSGSPKLSRIDLSQSNPPKNLQIAASSLKTPVLPTLI